MAESCLECKKVETKNEKGQYRICCPETAGTWSPVCSKSVLKEVFICNQLETACFEPKEAK